MQTQAERILTVINMLSDVGDGLIHFTSGGGWGLQIREAVKEVEEARAILLKCLNEQTRVG